MTTGTGVVASCTDAKNSGAETAHSGSVFGLEAGLRAGGVATSGLGHGAARQKK